MSGEVTAGGVIPHLCLLTQKSAQGVELLDRKVLHYAVTAVGQLKVDGGFAWVVMKVE
jgi:hypothetical protein